eukprot:328474_1
MKMADTPDTKHDDDGEDALQQLLNEGFDLQQATMALGLSNYTCICGKDLIQKDDIMDCPDTDMRCDQCKLSINAEQTTWFCNDHQGERDKRFYVCNDCITALDPNHNIKQINHLINKFRVLGMDHNVSMISGVIQSETNYHSSFIVSEMNQPLILVFRFNLPIYLDSLTIIASNGPVNGSPPKQIHIYKINHLCMSINDIKAQKPDYSFENPNKSVITIKHVTRHNYHLDKMRCMAVYIESNQDNTQTSFVNAIQLYGSEYKENESDDAFVPRKLTHHDIAKITNSIQDSMRLLYPMKEDTVKSDFTCDLSECLSLKIIGDVLKRYNYYLNNANEYIDEYVFSKIGNNYTNADLLDDFHHLQFKHSNQFEDIYDVLTKQIYSASSCELSDCLLMIRNQRDRAKITHNESILDEMYLNDDVVSQQLLDRIHAFYFHSFDIGFNLTNKEKNDIINCTQDFKHDDIDDIPDALPLHDVIRLKRRNYRSIHGLNRLNNPNNKFKTDTTDEKQNDFNEPQQYNYGVTFFYWKYLQHNHNEWKLQAGVLRRDTDTMGTDTYNWFIPNKYGDLKDELLNNKITTIGKVQLQNVVDKARAYAQTSHVKAMVCPRATSAQCYDMQPGQPISLDHLISMMVYCNYDTLQRTFSATFRKLNKTESNESLKQRHMNYHFLAKLLRESVECFGLNYIDKVQSTGFTPTNWNMVVFHGVDQHFTFSSMNAFIKGPFSTTTDHKVALSFCNDRGMVLEMCINFDWKMSAECEESMSSLMCMDMQWISDFSNEKEVFCIGGLNKFLYQSIHDVYSGVNYKVYIGGLRYLEQSLWARGRLFRIGETSAFDQQMAFILLSHELYRYNEDHPKADKLEDCPQYIEMVLHSHCLNTFQIKWRAQDHMLHYMFKDSTSTVEWPQLDLLTLLFPNLQELICYTGSHRAMYESVLKFIEKNPNSSLKQIQISCMCESAEQTDVEMCVPTYEERFKGKSWNISAEVIHPGQHYNLDFTRQLFTTYPDMLDKLWDNPDLQQHWKSLGGTETFFRELMQNPNKASMIRVVMNRMT